MYDGGNGLEGIDEVEVGEGEFVGCGGELVDRGVEMGVSGGEGENEELGMVVVGLEL